MTTPSNDQHRPRHAAHFSAPAAGQAPRPQGAQPRPRQAAPSGQRTAVRHQAQPRPAAPRPAAPRPGAARKAAAPRAQATVRHAGRNAARGGSAMTTNRMSGAAARATRRAGSHDVRREQTKRRGGSGLVVGGVLAAVIVVLAVVFVLIPSLNKGDGDHQQIQVGQTVNVSIPDGSGAQAVAQALFDAKVITSKSEFLTQASRMKAAESLKSGEYTITVGDDLASLVTQLTEGPNASGTKLTIPEGYTVARIADTVQQTLGISADDFKNQAKASNYVADYPFLEGAANDSLEGFLFPKTYSFGEGATADGIIRAMLTQFQNELATLDLSYAEGRGLSVAQIVNLASIVEKESTPNTQGAVAAIFWNRLENNGDPNYGFLQSDATTAYSVGHDPSADEVHDSSDPYSTYTSKGLPPTPICCPGLSSLQAVCAPDGEYLDKGYYYFFFYNDKDGNVQYDFSKTYEEHQQAIKNAQNK